VSIQTLVVVTGAVLLIVFANTVSRRVRVAGPLLLMLLGVGISLLPFVPAITVQPSVILVGVLPPLLYSAAVSAPAIEFRRELGAISGLAFALVIVSSLVLGGLFVLLIPGLGFPLAVALGAILSPTDAVATSIVRKLGAPRRILTMLEGESMLNDASALVLLRTAVAAAAASFSFVSTLGAFAWSVVSAVVIGCAVGAVALWLRARISSPTANTAIGLTVPYLAFVPTEAVGGSGLVAAVAAGVLCGQGAVRMLTPEQRISDKATWGTIEFVLEGAVFLGMGLELWGLAQDNIRAHEGLATPLLIAGAAFVVLILVRAAYAFTVPRLQSAHARRRSSAATQSKRRRRDPAQVQRRQADAVYYSSSPLSWRHSTLLVWAGMRGAVTLAAAQTLPADAPHRELLVLTAFVVAGGSLLVQGLTLPSLVRVLGLTGSEKAGPPYAEIRAIDAALRRTAQRAVGRSDIRLGDRSTVSGAVRAAAIPQLVAGEERAARGPESLNSDLALVRVMRARLHELGRSGRYSTAALRYVMDELDATEISIKLHLESQK